MIGLLTALPRTPLYERLEREGRLRTGTDAADNTKLHTNVVPKAMTYDAMLSAYTALHRRLADDGSIAARIRNKLRHFAPAHPVSPYGAGDRLRIVLRLLTKGIMPGGPRRIALFTRSLPWRSPRSMGQAILDWITALAIKDYVDRHLVPPLAQHRERAENAVIALRRRFERYIAQGALRFSLDRSASPRDHLQLALLDHVDPRFFRGLSRHLRRVLSRSTTTVTLQVHALREMDIPRLVRLLAKLDRYGERVRLALSDPLRAVIPADFRLILEPLRTEHAR